MQAVPAEPRRPFISYNSLESAAVVVPLVRGFVPADSVVDFGCKHGEWLSVFREHGSTRLRGFDLEKRIGHGLLINADEFVVADLRQPVQLNDRFDLAVCIEVAEHLPESAAAPLVRTLTSAAPAVLFSAAVPGQGGHGHLNEQPRQYWNDLFAAYGYTPIDCLRPRIWQDPAVAWWYRQNIFLMCSEEMRQSPGLRAEASRAIAGDLDLVHVDILNRSVFRDLASSVVSGLSRRLKRGR
jgi:hypothetical protein